MSERSKVEARARSLHELLDRHLHSPEERAQIAELRAAAVSASRIESLYPGTLLDLAPRLEVLKNQKPTSPEAAAFHDALVELSARHWVVTSLQERHRQQLFHDAFNPDRRGVTVAAVQSVSLRLTLALITTLVAEAFEDVEQDFPWGKVNEFLHRANEPLHLAHILLVANTEAS